MHVKLLNICGGTKITCIQTHDIDINFTQFTNAAISDIICEKNQ
jgi:hypothetical protein